MADTKREKQITWSDPAETLRDLSITGLEHMQAIRDGRIPPPPIAMLTGYRIVEVEQGRTVFELTPEECHYNPFSTVHGGILSTLLDTAMTGSVISTLPAGQVCTTVDITIKYMRPVTAATGTLQCTAKPIHTGKRLATAEGRITDPGGNLIAHGVSTCTIFTPKP
ncbi:MAG: PaaI family thioesterase [Thermodesulfobacteriota bacterium]|nr:PaaI family thioesterase [Thermodesulfobacteriota bacterium]